jgi:phosphate/sulfate permease
MNFFIKNGLVIFFICTILFKLAFIVPVALTHGFVYAIMAIGLMLLISKGKIIFSSQVVKTFPLFYSFGIISFFYFIILDLRLQSFFYLISKLSIFTLIIFGLQYNYERYKFWATHYLKYILLSLLVFGYFFIGTGGESERLSMGFNANDTGEFGLVGIMSILALEKKWNKKTIN